MDPRGPLRTPDPPLLRGIFQAPKGPLLGLGTRNPLPLHPAVLNPALNPARNPQRPRNPTCLVTRARAVAVNVMEITATASPHLLRRIGAVLPRIGPRWANLLPLRLPLPQSPVMRCLHSNVSLLISRQLRIKYLLPTTRSLLLCMPHKALTFLQTLLFFTRVPQHSLLLYCRMLLGTAKLHPLVHPLFLEISIRFHLTSGR